ncbi:MAG TPA: universal stress protein [Puia sp.]|nr:universal stress protein [Puia sp.]
MNKIIAAFDGLRFSESTMKYAIYLAKQYNAHLTGVFLYESTSLGFAVYTMIEKQSVSGQNIFKEIAKSDKIAINNAINNFETACRNAKLSYRVHRDTGNAARELLHETAFADLLIIDAQETFSYLKEEMPGWFIKNILHETRCAVLIVPKSFSPIKQSVLLYDGSPSSIFAIKMFNYILPEMGKLETKLLFAANKSSLPQLPDDKLLKEWIERHYSKVTYKILNGEEKKLTATLAKEKKEAVLVAGSYQRSNLSMLFHKSLADLLLKETKTPVFIAHC